MRKGIVLSLLFLAAGQLCLGYYIPLKAQLAQWLLQRAWRQGQVQQVAVRPWPWADISPLARLQIPQQYIDLIVLNGDSGAALAFAPGLRQLDAAGQVIMISAHRDTHFQFMQQLHAQETVNLLYRDGRRYHYRIVEEKIVDSRQPLQLHAIDTPLLILVTCYPFNAIQPGGPLRYLVIARQTFTTEPPINSARCRLKEFPCPTTI